MADQDPLDPKRFSVSEWKLIAAQARAKGDTHTADLAEHLARRAEAFEPTTLTEDEEAKAQEAANPHLGGSGAAYVASALNAFGGLGRTAAGTGRAIAAPFRRQNIADAFGAGEAEYDANLADTQAGHPLASTAGSLTGGLALAGAGGLTGAGRTAATTGLPWLTRLKAAMAAYGAPAALESEAQGEGSVLERLPRAIGAGALATALAGIPIAKDEVAISRLTKRSALRQAAKEPTATLGKSTPWSNSWPENIPPEPKEFSLRTLDTEGPIAEPTRGPLRSRRVAPVIQTEPSPEVAPPEGFEPTGSVPRDNTYSPKPFPEGADLQGSPTLSATLRGLADEGVGQQQAATAKAVDIWQRAAAKLKPEAPSLGPTATPVPAESPTPTPGTPEYEAAVRAAFSPTAWSRHGPQTDFTGDAKGIEAALKALRKINQD